MRKQEKIEKEMLDKESPSEERNRHAQNLEGKGERQLWSLQMKNRAKGRCIREQSLLELSV